MLGTFHVRCNLEKLCLVCIFLTRVVAAHNYCKSRLLLPLQCLPSIALPSGSVCAPARPRNARHLPNIDTRIAGSLYASNYLLAFWGESRLNWQCKNSRPSFTGLVYGLADG